MTGFVVAIPVGPGDAEVPRVLDGLDALRAHEPGAREVVLVDDAPGRAWPSDVTVLPNPRAGRGIGTLGGTTCATVTALAHAARHHPGAWVLRLDTDALVTGPFASAVDAELRPDDGLLGSCHRTCNGQVRDVRAIGREVRRHERPVWTFARPPRKPHWVRPAEPRTRRLLQQARAHGYVPGEHCIAAACVVTAPLVRAAYERGWLDDPRRWLQVRLGDDMVLGAMARAAGLQLRDLPHLFGLQHRGLPDSPPNLQARGFAVVHSVKDDPDHPEADVRAFFAGARAS